MTAQKGGRRIFRPIEQVQRGVGNLIRLKRKLEPETPASVPESQTDDKHEADEAWDEHSKPLNDQPPYESGEFPAFSANREHLRLELRRVGYFVRMQLRRYWGMLEPQRRGEDWSEATYHTHIQAYLGSDPLLTNPIADWAKETIDEDKQRAEALRQHIDQRRAELGSEQGRLRLLQLAERFSLSPQEIDIVLICLLPDLYRRYRLYFGYLQGDTDFQGQIAQPLPNLDTIRDILREIYPDDSVGIQSLLRHHLLVLEGGVVPASAMPQVQVDSHVARFLVGDDGLDTRLNDVVTLLDEPADAFLLDDPLAVHMDQFRQWYHGRHKQRIERAQAFYRRWRGQLPDPLESEVIGATLLLVGPYGVGKQRLAQAISAGAAPLLVAQTAAALYSSLGWETLVDLIYREGRFHDAAVYWAGCETLLNSPDERLIPQWAYLIAAAETYPHLTFLASEVPWEPKGRFLGEHTFMRVDLPAPSYALRVKLWKDQLEHVPHALRLWADADILGLAEGLANSFQFTAGQITDAMRSARAIALERAPNAPVATQEDVFAGCRRQVGRRLTSLARPFGADTKPSFTDLLLPEATCKQLEELKQLVLTRKATLSERGIEQRLARGKGIVAMFTGTSGTGKTTAAEVLAGEAGVDLYKVDLSAVVSKYVGDTEKQLNQVFTEAEAANAMLFFDEGDALFGKRGEVKDAQDRWANQEVNFLLQRIEEYKGVVILATNLAQNIDEAFRRRIHMIIEFPFPDRNLRRQIWQQMLSRAQYPELSDKEYDLLANFRLAGGSIQNIVLNAVSLKMDDENHMKPLILAITREYQKLGRPVTRTEFGRDYFKWIVDEKLL